MLNWFAMSGIRSSLLSFLLEVGGRECTHTVQVSSRSNSMCWSDLQVLKQLGRTCQHGPYQSKKKYEKEKGSRSNRVVNVVV